MLNGEAKPQSPECHAAVFRLGSAFRGLGGDPGGQVGKHHGRLGFVAVLSARAGSLRAGLPAGGKQGGGVEGGRVHQSGGATTATGGQEVHLDSDRFSHHNSVDAPVAQVDRAWDF